MKFNIICASHNENVLIQNLAASPFIKNNRVTLFSCFNNISQAYNFSEEHYKIYVHHDVFMPPSFEAQLKKAIQQINLIDTGWGVLGVAGAILENGQRKFYGHLNDRGKEWGTVAGLPREVQTIDELLLITKGDLIFDPQFDLHFYGADICMQAIKQGRKNYVIDAYVYHNSGLKPGERTESFYKCEAKFREKWKNYLPIVTTCSIL